MHAKKRMLEPWAEALQHVKDKQTFVLLRGYNYHCVCAWILFGPVAFLLAITVLVAAPDKFLPVCLQQDEWAAVADLALLTNELFLGQELCQAVIWFSHLKVSLKEDATRGVHIVLYTTASVYLILSGGGPLINAYGPSWEASSGWLGLLMLARVMKGREQLAARLGQLFFVFFLVSRPFAGSVILGVCVNAMVIDTDRMKPLDPVHTTVTPSLVMLCMAFQYFLTYMVVTAFVKMLKKKKSRDGVVLPIEPTAAGSTGLIINGHV